MSKTVLGVFHERTNAEEAINKLEGMGYNPKDISIVMRDKAEKEELESNTGSNVTGGAVSGAAAGGLIGALAGLLIGTGVIPGLGALLVAGPIAYALGLTGVAATTVSGAVTGAVAGGLIGALTGLGVSDEDAHMYEDSVRDGGILVMVPTKSGFDEEVSDLFSDYGATQVKTINSTPQTPTVTDHPAVTDKEYAPAYFSEVRREDQEELEDEEIAESEPVVKRTRVKRVKP